LNILVVPAILVTILLTAVMFALMPADEALTVHSTITDTGLTVKYITTDDGAPNAPIIRNSNTETITIDCDRDFILMSLHFDTSDDPPDSATDDLDYGGTETVGITIDGTNFDTPFLLGVDKGNEAWEGELMSQIFNAQTATTVKPGALAIPATGADAADIVFTFGGVAAGTSDEIDFSAAILTDAGATCTVIGS